jgi:hypothetical protein
MKKVILILSVLAWITLASVTGSQQKTATEKSVTTTPPPPPVSSPVLGKLEKIAGTIERVDDAGKILVVKGKKERLTFVVDDKTKIIRGGKDLPFSDLKMEMGVAVDYKLEGDRKIALTIRVAAPKAVPRERVPETPPESSKK